MDVFYSFFEIFKKYISLVDINNISFCLKVNTYKLLSAVIGSSFAALFAGSTPKVNPIVPEIITVIKTVPNPIVAGKGVNKATEQLFKFISSPEDMIKLGEDGLIEYIKTIGLYRNKARNVIKLSQILVDQYNGIVPN